MTEGYRFGTLVKWTNPDDAQDFAQGRINGEPMPLRDDLPQDDLGVFIHYSWRRIAHCVIIKESSHE